jgi:signal transduction histidine kinase
MCAAALAADASPSIERVGEMAATIRASVELMERIIRDLLDVSAIESGHLAIVPEPTPVVAVLALAFELAEPLAIAQGIALDVRSSVCDATVHADPERLQQALGNLLGNAFKFTPHGGRVTLRAAPSSDPAMVRFTVEDTGSGIAAEHLGHIFDRFWQVRETRRGGAGLGLAIVQGIVEAHGSTIGVESTPGVGTTFSFEIARG